MLEAITSDSKIWNEDEVISQLSYEMSHNNDIDISLVQEGPDLSFTNLYNILDKLSQMYSYDLTKVTIRTCNVFEKHSLINIIYIPPTHFVKSTIETLKDITLNKNNNKLFGIFIGRSNAPRLILSAELNKYNTLQSYHYDVNNDFHRDNLGLEDAFSNYQIDDINTLSNFIKKCPLKLEHNVTYPILMDQHNNFYDSYNNFFVEVVCETFFSGETFFPTEKTWRPIILKTPFIVQGPTGYLKNLRKLGFKTFSEFWDEGYDEDPPNWSYKEIIKVIEDLSSKSNDEIQRMYIAMQDILEHNYNTLLNLTREDFEKLNE